MLAHFLGVAVAFLLLAAQEGHEPSESGIHP
jgi:hypothetical protein